MSRRTANGRQVRTFHNVEVRATDRKGPNGRPVVELRIVTPGVVDDYGSVWLPNTFDRAITERIAADADDTPSLCWSHRWDDPIGHGISYQASADGPVMEFELDDFDAVPRARQAYAQVQSKTIRDCSVGFYALARRDATKDDVAMWPGAREVIVESDLDEVSLVLRGAVPGAKVLSVRSGGNFEAFLEIAKRKAAGELTDDEARAAVDLLDAEDPDDETGGNDGTDGTEAAAAAAAVELADAEAAADAALASFA